MGVGAQPTVAAYKLLSLVRISHTHTHLSLYLHVHIYCTVATVVKRGCPYSNCGAQTIAHAFAKQFLRFTVHPTDLHEFSSQKHTVFVVFMCS